MTLLEWCTHYSEWSDICSGKSKSVLTLHGDSEWEDATSDQAYAMMCMHIVDECCRLAVGNKWEDLLLSVTENIPYSVLGLSSDDIQTFLVFLSRKLQSV